MNLPLISVIVPVYNVEHELLACLNSILDQTYQNIEIILVNDGSTDKSGEIADSFATEHKGKIFCYHQNNLGVSVARLNGLDKARGEWIGFVDSDDVIEPEMYDKLLKNAIKYSADISHCGYQTIVNGGERIHYFYNTGRLEIQNHEKGLRDLLEGTYVEPSLCNKLFHRKLFDSILDHRDIFYGIRINEDLLMNYYLFKYSKLSVYEDLCLYHYLTRETSATRSVFNLYKIIDSVHVRKVIMEDSDNNLKQLSRKNYIVSNLYAYIAVTEKKEYKQYSNEIKKTLISNRDCWKELSRNNQIKLRLIMLSPFLYHCIFRVYNRFFMKKIYE